MLTLYTFPIRKPEGCFDMSGIPLDELVDTVVAIHSHQKTATLWFGYLDGWMLSSREEVLLRKAVRDFKCIVVSRFPLSFSQSWKNEIDWIYTEPLQHGLSNTHDNGRPLHDRGQVEYGPSRT